MRIFSFISLILPVLLISSVANAQSSRSVESLKREFAEKACAGIDSIQTVNKTPSQVSESIGICIERQSQAYLAAYKQAFGVTAVNDTVDFVTSTSSGEQKKAYFILERYMMSYCKSLRSTISATDKLKDFSLSANQKALEYYADGMKQYERNNYPQALTSFQKAVRTDPLFAFAWDEIGECFSNLGRYNEAINAYDQSLLIDSVSVFPLMNMALAYKNQKNYSKAVEVYKRLSTVCPENAEGYYGLAVISYLNNAYEDGLESLCKSYKIYLQTKSPYRTDAENLLSLYYQEMTKKNLEDKFIDVITRNEMKVQ